MFTNLNITGLLESSFLISLFFFVLGYFISFCVSFISWYKREAFFILANLKKIPFCFSRKKYILIWNDHNLNLSEKIIHLLQDKKLNYKFIAIKDSEDLLKYPLKTRYVREIILMITDVTKLARQEDRRKKIQEKIIAYVTEGGVLFGTHDLIYRRCRNHILQEAFGCETYTFDRVNKPIKAQVIEEYIGHPLLKDIDKNIEFDDGEVCYGEWCPDTVILFETVEKFEKFNNKNAPLLTIRSHGHGGILIWLNSADKTDSKNVAKSLSEPHGNIIKLIYNSIEYNKKIVDYHKSIIGHTS